MPALDRDKALDIALAQIDKQYGKGSVMRLGDESRVPIEVIPTGSIALDVALGIGGLPRGRVIEIYGPESSGKTTVALHAVANAQAAGGIAAFIDAEHALDPDYAKALGVDTDALLVSQPDTGEQALEIADMLIRSGALDVIVIDSVAALVPRAEIEGEMGDSHVGLQARLMSQALRKITGALSNSGTTAIFINQLREKIGVMFGSPETTTGGKALKFYASVRIDVRRIETLKDGSEAVGNRTRVKVVKNKVAPPFKQAEFDIIYGQGISREGSLIDVGVEQSIIRKSGAWYTYEGDQLGQGKENVRSFLRDNPDLADEIEKKIKEKLGVGRASWTRTWRCPPRSTSRPCTTRTRAPSPGCPPPRRPGPPAQPAAAPAVRTGCRGRRDRATGPVAAEVGRGAARRRGAGRGVAGPRVVAPGAIRRTRRATRSRWPGRSACACSPCSRGPVPSWPRRWPGGTSRTRPPPSCSAASPRSGSSTTGRSPRPGSARGTPAAGWPAGRWPPSCAAAGSTARPSARRSPRSTPRPRSGPPGSWWPAAAEHPPAGARGPGPAAGRDARPQGLPAGARGAGRARGSSPRTATTRASWPGWTTPDRTTDHGHPRVDVETDQADR